MQSISNFPCSLTRNITPHSMKNLPFHSLLRRKIIILPILTNSLIRFSLKGWENVLFEFGSERVSSSSQLQVRANLAQLISLWSSSQDPCESVRCEFYSICRPSADRASHACECPTNCSRVSSPVCGSDGSTYENECLLQSKACAEKKAVRVTSLGACGEFGASLKIQSPVLLFVYGYCFTLPILLH